MESWLWLLREYFDLHIRQSHLCELIDCVKDVEFAIVIFTRKGWANNWDPFPLIGDHIVHPRVVYHSVDFESSIGALTWNIVNELDPGTHSDPSSRARWLVETEFAPLATSPRSVETVSLQIVQCWVGWIFDLWEGFHLDGTPRVRLVESPARLSPLDSSGARKVWAYFWNNCIVNDRGLWALLLFNSLQLGIALSKLGSEPEDQRCSILLRGRSLVETDNIIYVNGGLIIGTRGIKIEQIWGIDQIAINVLDFYREARNYLRSDWIHPTRARNRYWICVGDPVGYRFIINRIEFPEILNSGIVIFIDILF